MQEKVKIICTPHLGKFLTQMLIEKVFKEIHIFLHLLPIYTLKPPLYGVITMYLLVKVIILPKSLCANNI